MIRRILGVIRRYPSVGVSAAMIAVLIGLSIYTLIALPLPKALSMWRAERDVWKYTPANARPAWTNLLRQEKLPTTFIIPTREADIVTEPLNETLSSQTMRLLFTYDNTHLPSEVVFFFNVRIGSKIPLLTIHWIRPDGMEVELRSGPANPGPARELIDPSAVFGAVDQHKLTIGTGSFGGDGDEEVLPGEHMLVIKALAFDEGFALDGELVVYGRVHGLAGTDTRRRDLTIGLLWGTPIALMFGLIAAVGTTLLGFVIAAAGAWYGGWIDAAIQRLTEINMMIPLNMFNSKTWIQ